MGASWKRYVGTVSWIGPDMCHMNLRWVTRAADNGRAYGRAPRAGVLLNDLKLLREDDFGPERIIPKSHKEVKVLHRRG